MAITSIRYGKKGLLLTAGALFAVNLMMQPAGAGYAQTQGDVTGLINRLNQIETQMQTLSRSVYRGEAAPAGASMGGGSGADSASVAAFEDRLSQLEQQQRALTGQIEEALHLARQAQQQMQKVQADYDMRLQQLEQGGGASGAYTAPATNDATPTVTGNPVIGGDNSAAGTGAPSTGSNLGTLSSSGATSGTPESVYETAFTEIREGRYDSAEKGFRNFLSQYPKHTLAANAQYWLAETYYVRGDYKQSSKLFAQGYQEYPQGQKAADSLLKLGLSLSRMGRKDDACLSLQQLKKEFPGDSVPANRRATQELKNLGCA